MVNYSDSPTVSDGDCVGSFKVGSSTSLNTDNQGIRRRVLNYYSKSVTCPITSREDPNRHVTCMDVARTGGMWLLGDDHGSLTVFRGGTTVKRFRLPNLPTSYTLPEGIPGPVSPNGYVEVVKWACDGRRAVVGMRDRVMLVDLETEKVELEFMTLLALYMSADDVPLGPVARVSTHPADPTKSIVSFYLTKNQASRKYYTISRAGLKGHNPPSDREMSAGCTAVYKHDRDEPDSVVLLTTYTGIDPTSPLVGNPHNLKGKDFARIRFLSNPGEGGVETFKTEVLQPSTKKTENKNFHRKGGRIFVSPNSKMIVTTGVGTGIRVYSSKDLALIGVFGEGIKLDGTLTLEYTECFLVRAHGKIWAVGLPIWWRVEQGKGELFQKIHMWQVCGEKEEDATIKASQDRVKFKYKFATFSERSIELPSSMGVLQADFDGSTQTILAVGLEGGLFRRTGKVSQEWPGPMYPPGYKIVHQNYYYLEQEDELDKVENENGNEREGKNKGTAKARVAEGGKRGKEGRREREEVDVFGRGVKGGGSEVGVRLKFEKEEQLKLKLEDLKRDKKINKARMFVDTDAACQGGDEDEGIGWFMDLVPKPPSAGKGNEKKDSMQKGKLSPPSVPENDLRGYIRSLRTVVANGSGSSFKTPTDTSNDCKACMGRLWVHTCGRERGLPVHMQKLRNERDEEKRKAGVVVDSRNNNRSVGAGRAAKAAAEIPTLEAFDADANEDGRCCNAKIFVTADGKPLNEATLNKLKRNRENAAKKKGTLGGLKPAARVGVRVKCSEIGDNYYGVSLVPVKKKGGLPEMEVRGSEERRDEVATQSLATPKTYLRCQT